MKRKKVAVVTGGTSGIGESAVQELLQCGCTVYDLSRREAGTVPGATHLSCDVTNESQVNSVVQTILEKEKHIDILVNNAGFGISGAIEFTELSDAKKQLDVNFFGTVNMTKAVLPGMRKQKHGRIINVSSVAAPIAIPFQAYYSVSKSAILTYSLALLNEVRPFHIKVTTVLPGDIRTGFTDVREKSARGDREYHGRITKSVKTMEHDERNGMDPSVAGKLIAKQALCRKPKVVCTTGKQYQLFVFLTRVIPYRAMYKIVGMIYG